MSPASNTPSVPQDRVDLILRAFYDLAREWCVEYVSFVGVLDRIGFMPTREEMDEVLATGWVKRVGPSGGPGRYLITLDPDDIYPEFS